jgi:glycosyltransferase involved in cell wall biosynthesis
MKSPPSPVLVNTSFRMQRITGQQRYALEISSRLLQREGFKEAGPAPWFARSSLRAWGWVFTALETRARGSVLLSLTARAPLLRRQVLVIHDLFVLTNPEWFSRLYVLTHAALLRLQLKRAIGVVAVSQPVADEVRELFSGPIVVAPNAPSQVFSTPPPANDDALSSRGLQRRGYLLAVGSMDPRKNLPVLAEAYGALGPEERQALPLVLVGGGAAIYRDQEISWSSGVVSAGYVSDEELRSLYAGARAVVFPSLAEGFGLPLVEAAAAGSAALAISDIPVFRWVCGEGATYFDPLSVPSVTDALRRVASQPVPVAVSVERFDWDASAAIVADLCESVIAGAASVEGSSRV